MRRPHHVRENLRLWRRVMIPRILVNVGALVLHLLSPERR
jgi:hypothetical protein